MLAMTTAEKLELALIPAMGVASWFIAGRLPASFSIGGLLLAASVLLLLQSLIRDLWLLRKSQPSRQGARREALCMCVESTVGVTGVVAGLVLLGSTIDARLSPSPLLVGLQALGTLAFGFAVKDLVLEFRPFRIRRDKDHLNIVFSWKR